jgi:hypothetical protein
LLYYNAIVSGPQHFSWPADEIDAVLSGEKELSFSDPMLANLKTVNQLVDRASESRFCIWNSEIRSVRDDGWSTRASVFSGFRDLYKGVLVEYLAHFNDSNHESAVDTLGVLLKTLDYSPLAQTYPPNILTGTLDRMTFPYVLKTVDHYDPPHKKRIFLTLQTTSRIHLQRPIPFYESNIGRLENDVSKIQSKNLSARTLGELATSCGYDNPYIRKHADEPASHFLELLTLNKDWEMRILEAFNMPNAQMIWKHLQELAEKQEHSSRLFAFCNPEVLLTEFQTYLESSLKWHMVYVFLGRELHGNSFEETNGDLLKFESYNIQTT